MQQSVEVSWVDHCNCFLLGLHALINEVASDLQSSLSSSLTVSGLQHVELLVLNSELHILHVVIVVLQSLANFLELSESLREGLSHLLDRHRSTNACNNVLALCIGQELAHQLLLAGSGISCEGNACTAVITHVAECHRLYVNSSTPAERNIVVTSVNVSSGVIPRTEYSLDSAHQLLLRIVREVNADLRLVFSLELTSQYLQVISSQLNVLSYAPLFLHLVDQLFKVLLADLHNNVRIHLDKSSVAVPSPSGVIGLLSDSVNNSFVQTQIEDSIHHTWHRSSCARTNGNEQRIFLVAELLAGNTLHLNDILIDLLLDLLRDTAVLIILCASLSSDSEALGNRKTDVGHLSQVSALTAEQLSHVGITLREEIAILCCHRLSTSINYFEFPSYCTALRRQSRS